MTGGRPAFKPTARSIFADARRRPRAPHDAIGVVSAARLSPSEKQQPQQQQQLRGTLLLLLMELVFALLRPLLLFARPAFSGRKGGRVKEDSPRSVVCVCFPAACFCIFGCCCCWPWPARPSVVVVFRSHWSVREPSRRAFGLLFLGPAAAAAELFPSTSLLPPPSAPPRVIRIITETGSGCGEANSELAPRPCFFSAAAFFFRGRTAESWILSRVLLPGGCVVSLSQ